MISFWVFYGVFCIDVVFLILLALGRGKLDKEEKKDEQT